MRTTGRNPASVLRRAALTAAGFATVGLTAAAGAAIALLSGFPLGLVGICLLSAGLLYALTLAGRAPDMIDFDLGVMGAMVAVAVPFLLYLALGPLLFEAWPWPLLGERPSSP